MNKKAQKTLSAATVASVLMASSVAAVNVKAASTTDTDSARLGGADRYETAVKVSQAGWTGTSDYVIIASGEGFADALCAAPLASANKAPVLLATKDSISQSTLDELKRLKVKHVYIVGGEGVISEAITEKIKSAVSSDIERLGGKNRYETSVKIAEKLGVTTKIVLASGQGYADALSAAPAAAIEGMPILLTEGTVLPDATAAYIKANPGITKTYVIGGIGSVSKTVESSVPGAVRFGGTNRFETNAKVLEGFAADFDFSNVYVALGQGSVGNEFADALTGAALAGKNKSPLVITGVSGLLDDSVQTVLKSKLKSSSKLSVLGGKANVSDNSVSNIEKLKPTPAPASGGGGSSSGVKNITNTVRSLVKDKFDAAVVKYPKLANYVTLDTTTATDNINIGLLNNNLKSLSSLFEVGQSQTEETIKARLDKIQDQIEAQSEFVIIDKMSLQQVFAKIDSQYLNDDGSLNTALLAEKIYNNELDYATFKEELLAEIKTTFDTEKTTPVVKLNGIQVARVKKDGDIVYNSDWTRAKVIESLLSISQSTTGTYLVYVGDASEYIKVTVVDATK